MAQSWFNQIQREDQLYKQSQLRLRRAEMEKVCNAWRNVMVLVIVSGIIVSTPK